MMIIIIINLTTILAKLERRDFCMTEMHCTLTLLYCVMILSYTCNSDAVILRRFERSWCLLVHHLFYFKNPLGGGQCKTCKWVKYNPNYTM